MVTVVTLDGPGGWSTVIELLVAVDTEQGPGRDTCPPSTPLVGFPQAAHSVTPGRLPRDEPVDFRPGISEAL